MWLISVDWERKPMSLNFEPKVERVTIVVVIIALSCFFNIIMYSLRTGYSIQEGVIKLQTFLNLELFGDGSLCIDYGILSVY